MCLWDEASADCTPSVSRLADVKARKAYICVECNRQINVGERCQYVFQIYDGDPYSCYTCEHCQTAQAWLRRECGGYVIDCIWEDIREHIKEHPGLKFPLGRLIVQKNKQWTKNGQLMSIPPVPEASIADFLEN